MSGSQKRVLRIFETHLDVADLKRSLEFYTAVLGLEIALRRELDQARTDAHSRGAREFALLWVGRRGQAMLGLWERSGQDIRPQHFAFEIGVEELPARIAELARKGVELRDFFQEYTTTPTVFGFIPAASIYFADPDGHVLELLARLPQRPRPELGAVSWSEWDRIIGRGA
jgi:lactoylglutathione lyase